MSIEFEDFGDNLRRISMSGRLDIPGTDAISIRFAALTGSGAKGVILDLTQVSFLASIGIRAIITNAKAMSKHNGRMVIFVGENESVSKTLETTGVDTLIPLHTTIEGARNALLV